MKKGIVLLCLFGAAALGCSVEESLSPLQGAERFAGTLSVDIRGSAAVTLEASPKDGSVLATLALSEVDTFGVFEPAAPLSGEGTREVFPEAGLTLYTAKLGAPALASGPCGSRPVALALSLARRGEASRVAGAFTAYCGEGNYAGVPVAMLRLSGELPPR